VGALKRRAGVGEMSKRRQICERAVFDGSADDPRVLVHWDQQRMRAQLLASVAQENAVAADPVVATTPRWATYLSRLSQTVRRFVPTRAAAEPAPMLASLHTFPSRQPVAARSERQAIAA
jgi:hypothetical protein